MGFEVKGYGTVIRDRHIGMGAISLRVTEVANELISTNKKNGWVPISHSHSTLVVEEGVSVTVCILFSTPD